MPKRKFLCIHGHFYQPPRENAWLEEIETQASAAPYHDWNQRINAECYHPNAFVSYLSPKKHIEPIANNYAKMSFNFGPTLLSWMKKSAPDVYQQVLAADRESRNLFSNHGSAMAQIYNHVIMPLANRRDKYTQVVWGILDFKHRFERPPEGMWLPETAVDLETLEVMAQQGILFTILSPHQAKRIRPIGRKSWRRVPDNLQDTFIPYYQNLPSGNKIAVFFYHSDLSNAVAFGEALKNGKVFLAHIKNAFNDRRKHDQLVHLAVDGETFGHHRRNGDVALAYVLNTIEAEFSIRLTNYGEYLANHPPTHEVDIVENSSWSCSHGVERWRADCGCRNDLQKGRHQAWRKPLREALDWLRDAMADHFEARAGKYLKDPWQARNAYGDLLVERTPERLDLFLKRHSRGRTSAGASKKDQRIEIIKLLEMQRHALLMYTSCGWFFDELSGIETIQIIQYAVRALQLLKETDGPDLLEHFLDRLEKATSNIPEFGNGRRLFEKTVRPSMVGWILPETI